MSLTISGNGLQLFTNGFACPIHTAGRRNEGLRKTPNFLDEPKVITPPMSRAQIVSASRSLYANSGIVKSAIDKKANYSIGRAFVFRSQAKSNAAEYDKFIHDFYKVACVDGHNFNSLLYLISTAIDVDGDCFVKLVKAKSGFPQLQFIRANRIKSTSGKIESGAYTGYEVFEGVVTNELGREIAYVLDGEKVIPAEEMIHCKDVSFFATVRGECLFAHAINNCQYLDDINEAELHAMKINAQIALLQKTVKGDLEGYDSDPYSQGDKGETVVQSIGNGQILAMTAGSGVELSVPSSQRPTQNYQSFSQRLIEICLAGAGVPYDIALTPISSGVGNRLSLDVFDKTCIDRTTLLADIAKQLIEFALACGIEAGFIKASAEWWNMTFSRPRKPSVDLGRDSNAMINEYNNGLRSLTQICEENGTTLDEYIETLKAEKEKLKAAGLTTSQVLEV